MGMKEFIEMAALVAIGSYIYDKTAYTVKI